MAGPNFQNENTTAGAIPPTNESTASQSETAGAKDAARDVAQQAKKQARAVKDEVVTQAKDTAGRAKEQARSSLDQGKGQIAEQVGSIATAFRRTTEQLRQEDQTRVAGYTESLADQIERVSGYLRDRDLRELTADLENLAHRRPTAFLGSAFALGLLGARFLKSSGRSTETATTRYSSEAGDLYDERERTDLYGSYSAGTSPLVESPGMAGPGSREAPYGGA